MLSSRSSAMLLICTSSYPGGGSLGGGNCSDDSLIRPRSPLDEVGMPPAEGLAGHMGEIGVGCWMGGGDGTGIVPPTSSYAGSCSRSTEWSTGCPLSLAISEACDSVSLICSYVDWKSKAPPSLNVILIFKNAWCDGIPPPVTGCSIPTQAFGPKKGAVTSVSWKLSIGAENDLNWWVGSAGR